jgi:hypothetical protein
MDQKAWIAAIVGLIVGVLLGVFVCAGGDTTTPPPKDGSRGDPPPLPSSLVESMPEGSWPKAECMPGQKAIDYLDEISTLAWDAKNAEMCTPMQWQQIYNRCCEIAMNPALQANAPAHCTKLEETKTAAMNNEWQMAVDHLEHIN